MKTKFILFFMLTLFFSALVSRQNELIKIPKEERQLIQVPEKILVGKALKISDGDSFTLENGENIRLFGIDAPELNQTCILSVEVQNKDNNKTIIKEEIIKCGENSKNKLSDLIASNKLKCIIKGKDAYDRFVGECSFERYNRRTRRRDKININKEMVLSGNAVAFSQISEKYIEDENRAKSGNKGVWATTFDMPSVYRKRNEK